MADRISWTGGIAMTFSGFLWHHRFLSPKTLRRAYYRLSISWIKKICSKVL